MSVADVERYIAQHPNLEWGSEIIHHQSAFPSVKGTFGSAGSIPDNACGAIATHNVLRLLGKDSKFSELLLQFNKAEQISMNVYGWLGSSLPYMLLYLKKRGCKSTIFNPSLFKSVKDGSVFLVFYTWHCDGAIGAHYQAAYKTNGKLFAINNTFTTTGFKALFEREGAIAPQVYLIKGR